MKGKMYFDGASVPNPGNSGVGVVIYEKKKVVCTIGQNIGFHTNNEAEFLSLKIGLEKAVELGFKELDVFGDSQLVIFGMIKKFKVRKIELIRIETDIREIMKSFEKLRFHWIPRERNTKADYYSNIGVENEVLERTQKVYCIKEKPKSGVIRRRNNQETRIV